ncbi:hypothetical protein RvY_16496 [Ramazzottius varieornatus]|uniref:Protein aurora borealis n=1 Tax=Ramazzottius varieornatus TaxID=947166 RepID=A0A1D1VZZ6_RAMVA|nr:hypothetical protein RvY_16496 [Ramazzottius varieornatus]
MNVQMNKSKTVGRSDNDSESSSSKRLKSLNVGNDYDFNAEKISRGTQSPARNHGCTIRQATSTELCMSSPRRGRARKRDEIDEENRDGQLKKIDSNHVPAMTFDRLRKVSPIKMRKFHTEPLLKALYYETKKETGHSPKIPDKSFNPFEPENLADFMERSITSATMFSERPKSPEGFQWDIHHMAELGPVEIDNKMDLIRTELMKHVHTDSEEEHAQVSIRKYFEHTYDLPSPASTDDRPTLFPDIDIDSPTGTFVKISSRSHLTMRTVECQTDVHIPIGFDFDRFLADHKVRLEKAEKSSKSRRDSVRRRLFVSQESSEDEESVGNLEVSGGFVSSTQRFTQQHRSSGFGDRDFLNVDAPLNVSPVMSPVHDEGSDQEMDDQDMKI